MHSYIKIGSRDSKLARAQVDEVLKELRHFYSHIHFESIWLKTKGDLDLETSLRLIDKTDFFTKELDEMLLKGAIQVAIHSAKDLPEPLPSGLKVVALTKGVDPADSLVFNKDILPIGGKIGTSSERREKEVLKWRSDLKCVDVRGSVDKRLELLDKGKLDGLVIAEAALIRLNLTHRKRIRLECETAPLQGRLAVLAKKEDAEMEKLFSCLHVADTEFTTSLL